MDKKNTASSLFKDKVINQNTTIDISALKTENKKIQSFMIEPTIKNLLLQHFKQQGITWGAGIRIIIIDYLKREKVIK